MKKNNNFQTFKLNKIFILVNSIMLPTLLTNTAFSANENEGARGGVISGIASGENAISIGNESYATSKDGSATGSSSIATGGNISREDFDSFLQNLGNLINKQNTLKSQKNQASATLNNAKEKIRLEEEKITQLQSQIDALQTKVNGTDVGNLSNQKSTAQGSLDSLTGENGAYTNALNNVKKVRSETGLNIFADFSGMINNLNWDGVKNESEEQKVNILAQELLNKVNSINPNIIIGNGTQENPQYGLNDFKDIIQGSLTTNGNYQALFAELQKRNGLISNSKIYYEHIGSNISALRYFMGNNNWERMLKNINYTKNAKNIKPTAETKSSDDSILSLYKPNLTVDYYGINNNILKTNGEEIEESYTIKKTEDNYLVVLKNSPDNYNSFNNNIYFKNGSIYIDNNRHSKTLKQIKDEVGEEELSNNVQKMNLLFTKAINTNIIISEFFKKNKFKLIQINPYDQVFYSKNKQIENGWRYYGDYINKKQNITSVVIFDESSNKYISTYPITNIVYNNSLHHYNYIYNNDDSIKSEIQSQYTLNALLFDTSLRQNLANNTYDIFLGHKKILEKIKENTYIPDVLDQNFYNGYINRRIEFFNDLIKEPDGENLGGILYYFNQNAINSTNEYSDELQLARNAFIQKWGSIAGYVNSEGQVDEELFKTKLNADSIDDLADFFDDMYSGNGGPGKRVYGGLALSEKGMEIWNQSISDTAEFRKKIKDNLITYDPTLDVIQDIVAEGNRLQQEYDTQKAEKDRLENLINDLTKQIEQAGKDGQELNSLQQQLENQKQLKQQADEALIEAERQLNDVNTKLDEVANEIQNTAIVREKGVESIATGARSFTSGDYALAIGSDSTATGDGSIAIGKDSTASGTSAIAIGRDIMATTEKAIAIGQENEVNGVASITIGSSNTINGENSVSMGQNNQITGDKSLAVGYGHTVKGNNSGTFGDPNIIEANNAYVIGNNNRTYADNSLSFGNNNIIGAQLEEGDTTTAENRVGYGSLGIGNNINIQGKNAVVLGNNTKSSNDYNIVLGFGSSDAYTPPASSTASTAATTATTGTTTSQPAGTGSIVSVGNAQEGLYRKIINVAEGEISSTSKEAINGSQLNDLNVKITNLTNMKADIDKALEDIKNNASNVTITNHSITVTQRAGQGTPDKSDDVYQGSVLGSLTDEQKAAGVTSLVLTDLAEGNVTSDSKDAITGSQLNKTANDIAKHLGGGATNNAGSITAPTYTVTDVDGTTDKTYNNVGAAVDALNKLAKSGANSKKAFESVAENLGGGATYDEANKVVTKPTYKVDDIVENKEKSLDNVGSAIEVLNKNSKALSQVVTYNIQNTEGLRNAIAQNANDIFNIKKSIDNIQIEMNKYRKEAKAGIASAMAIASIPINSYYKYTFGVGTAYHGGQSALAISFKSKTDNEKHIFNLSGAVNSNKDVSVAAGYSFGF